MGSAHVGAVVERVTNVLSEETVQSALDSYLRAIDSLDADAFADCFAADGVSYDPVGAPPHEGREALRQFAQGLFAATDRLSFNLDYKSIHGNSAAMKWTGHLAAKSGRSVTFEGIDVVEVDDARKIRLLKAYWNPGPVLAALQG